MSFSASAVRFTALTDSQGEHLSRSPLMSANGQFITSHLANSGQPVHWSECAVTPIDIVSEQVSDQHDLVGLNSTGEVVVGVSELNSDVASSQQVPRLLWAWSPDGAFYATQSTLTPTGLSADGGTVIGSGTDPVDFARYLPYRWQIGGDVESLKDGDGNAFSGRPLAVSSDGSVIVGLGENNTPFRWEQESGAVLIALPANLQGAGQVLVSNDGLVIVGNAVDANGISSLWQLRQGELRVLNTAQAGQQWLPTAMSGDGDVLAATRRDVATGEETAMMWDDNNGFRDLRSILQAQGVNLSEWQISQISSMDSTGSKLVGTGITEGGAQAWLADLNGASAAVRFTGDFNADGVTDILWRNRCTGQNWLYTLSGALAIPPVAASHLINVAQDTDWRIAGIGDFNADGTDDLLWRHDRTGINWVYLFDDGQVVSSKRLNKVLDQHWVVAEVGDLDGDGTDDILWRNTQTGLNWIYQMREGEIAASVLLNSVPDQAWTVSGLLDVNQDGTEDILWFNPQRRQLWVYQMADLQIAQSSLMKAGIEAVWQPVGANQSPTSVGEIIWRHNSTQAIRISQVTPTGLTERQFDPDSWHHLPERQEDIVGVGEYQPRGFLTRHRVTGELKAYFVDGVAQTAAGNDDDSRVLNAAHLSDVPDLRWRVNGM